jgi:hypothetical protein
LLLRALNMFVKSQRHRGSSGRAAAPPLRTAQRLHKRADAEQRDLEGHGKCQRRIFKLGALERNSDDADKFSASVLPGRVERLPMLTGISNAAGASPTFASPRTLRRTASRFKQRKTPMSAPRSREPRVIPILGDLCTSSRISGPGGSRRKSQLSQLQTHIIEIQNARN